MTEKLSHEAVEWFVWNEAGGEDWEHTRRWEKWCAKLVNRSWYISVLQLVEDLRSLPPPEVDRHELLKDAAS